MKILHTITLSTWRPFYEAFEEHSTSIVRDRVLTYKGVERILRKKAKIAGQEFTSSVVRIQTAIYN